MSIVIFQTRSSQAFCCIATAVVESDGGDVAAVAATRFTDAVASVKPSLFTIGDGATTSISHRNFDFQPSFTGLNRKLAFSEDDFPLHNAEVP